MGGEGEAAVEAGREQWEAVAVFPPDERWWWFGRRNEKWLDPVWSCRYFLFHGLGPGDTTRTERHTIEKEWKALLPSYPARLASKETMLERVVLLLGGAQANSDLHLMPFVKPLLKVQEVGPSRVLLINLILLSWKNLKGILILFLKKSRSNFHMLKCTALKCVVRCVFTTVFTCVTHTPIKIGTVPSPQTDNTYWS